MRLPVTVEPRRHLITAVPSKLDYFARANAIRAGVGGTWGALSGFDASPDSPVATSEDVKAAGTFQTIGNLFGSIGRSLLGAQSAPPPVVAAPREEPSAVPYVLIGVGAAGLAGYVVYRLMK